MDDLPTLVVHGEGVAAPNIIRAVVRASVRRDVPGAVTKSARAISHGPGVNFLTLSYALFHRAKMFEYAAILRKIAFHKESLPNS
jgi:hypothetical protein